MDESLKEKVLMAARKLFMEKGYEAVGMRDIARSIHRHPVQIYRLNLSKMDILAELILELNREQILHVPRLRASAKGQTLFDRTCSYLRELYSLDIRSLPIRSVGAAFGWLWSDRYERQVIEQVHQLIQPLIDWMEEAELDDIPARCLGIWSLYYVGYRHAVVQGGTADDCLAAIKPSLRYYLEFPRPMELAKGSNNQRNKNKARSKGPMDVPLKVH